MAAPFQKSDMTQGASSSCGPLILGSHTFWSESLISMDKGNSIMIKSINLVSDTPGFKFQLHCLLACNLGLMF